MTNLADLAHSLTDGRVTASQSPHTGLWWVHEGNLAHGDNLTTFEAFQLIWRLVQQYDMICDSCAARQAMEYLIERGGHGHVPVGTGELLRKGAVVGLECQCDLCQTQRIVEAAFQRGTQAELPAGIGDMMAEAAIGGRRCRCETAES